MTCLLIAFYVGAILGSNVVCFWIKYTFKRRILLLSICLFIISSSVLVADNGNYWHTSISRFIAGFAHGLVYITSVIHIGEIAIRNLRAILVLSFHQHLGGSLFVTILLMVTTDTFNLDIFQSFYAIGFIIFSLQAIVQLFIYFIESPVYYIQKELYRQSMANTIKLRNENVETWETRNDFTSNKLMVTDDKRDNISMWGYDNLRRMITVITSLLIYIASYNYSLNSVRLSLIENNAETKIIAPWVTFFFRLMFGHFLEYFIEHLSTRFIQIFSGFVAGLSLIFNGILHMSQDNVSHWVITSNFVVYEIFGLMGIGFMSVLMQVEAFPTTIKSNSLCFIFNLENILHILFIALTTDIYPHYEIFFMFIFGGIIIILTGIIFWIMPETKQLPLKECVSIYKGRKQK